MPYPRPVTAADMALKEQKVLDKTPSLCYTVKVAKDSRYKPKSCRGALNRISAYLSALWQEDIFILFGGENYA